MSKSRDSLHLHILAKSWSSSFLFWHKKRGESGVPRTAWDVSDKPRITHTCAQGRMSHPAPQLWIYIPEGKTTPNTISCQAQATCRDEGDFTSFNICGESGADILHPCMGGSNFRTWDAPQKEENSWKGDTQRFHLQRSLSSSIAISKQFHRMKIPDTTRPSNQAK